MKIHSDNPQHGLQFPGEFEISAMGAADAELHRHVPRALEARGLLVRHDTLRQRLSAKGNYVSVTVTFAAQTRQDYEGAHEALRAIAAVKWTL
jgi:putative lipoic acid-binding regulatory protein